MSNWVWNDGRTKYWKNIEELIRLSVRDMSDLTETQYKVRWRRPCQGSKARIGKRHWVAIILIDYWYHYETPDWLNLIYFIIRLALCEWLEALC